MTTPRLLHHRSTLVLCTLSLLLFLICTLTSTSTLTFTTFTHAADSSTPASYIVLIDGGSTGSRAYVHQYKKDGKSVLPVVEGIDNRKIKPGLSSYALDPPAVRTSILDLLTFIKTVVPESAWSVTPIHLQATAGLRSVTPQQAHDILEVVRDELAVSGFLFHRSWARIISGEQEGINGWMAVNYLLGIFDKSTTETPASTGVVEMGGSSMQITFAPSAPSAEDRKQLQEINIAGHTYYLYTHSFLQYGLQAAQQRYQTLVIDEIEANGNPCYPRAYRHSATGNFALCTTLMNKVVDKSVKCATSPCSFNGVYQPQIKGEQFLAIENFYYTAKFFGTHEQQVQQQQKQVNDGTASSVATTGNQLTRGLRLKGQEFCNKEWPQLVAEYAPTPEQELASFCFSAAYQSIVLENGLGFIDSTSDNLHVAKTINGKSIDWELGATLFELIGEGISGKDGKSGDDRKSTSESETSGAQTRTQHLVDLMDPGVPLTSRTSSLTSFRTTVATHPSFCFRCFMYTLLFALIVILAYATWNRYSKRTSGERQMTNYSQAAFNRV